LMEPDPRGQNQMPRPALVSDAGYWNSCRSCTGGLRARLRHARNRFLSTSSGRARALPPVGTGRLGGRLRPPAEAAKEKPRPPSGLAIGASTWRVEVTLRPPPRDPLKRNSHTLVRLRFIDKDASSKENHCDIFATINRHPKPVTRAKPGQRPLDEATRSPCADLIFARAISEQRTPLLDW